MRNVHLLLIAIMVLLGACTQQPAAPGNTTTDTTTNVTPTTGTSTNTPASCPQYMPPAPGFCPNGTIVPGGKNAQGCPMPPTCANVHPLTQDYCEAAHGHWVPCGSACRGHESDFCTAQCVEYCACGGIAGFGCPDGYKCTDYLPSNTTPDAMGICKPA